MSWTTARDFQKCSQASAHACVHSLGFSASETRTWRTTWSRTPVPLRSNVGRDRSRRAWRLGAEGCFASIPRARAGRASTQETGDDGRARESGERRGRRRGSYRARRNGRTTRRARAHARRAIPERHSRAVFRGCVAARDCQAIWRASRDDSHSASPRVGAVASCARSRRTRGTFAMGRRPLYRHRILARRVDGRHGRGCGCAEHERSGHAASDEALTVLPFRDATSTSPEFLLFSPDRLLARQSHVLVPCR